MYGFCPKRHYHFENGACFKCNVPCLVDRFVVEYRCKFIICFFWMKKLIAVFIFYINP